jgi:hypothetical protein
MEAYKIKNGTLIAHRYTLFSYVIPKWNFGSTDTLFSYVKEQILILLSCTHAVIAI